MDKDNAEDLGVSENHKNEKMQYPEVSAGTGATAVIEGAQTKQVHNAELFAALQETKIKLTSKDSLLLYYCIFVAFCCACANGYDTSLMTSILAMSHFQDTFHTGTTGSKVSVIFSMYTVGAMLFAPAGAILSDRFGRRVAMFSGGCIIIIGMVIVSTASTLAQFIVGRFLLGGGISFMTLSAPAYAIEIAPPHWRGRCVGFYNCGYFGGSIPAAAVTFGTNYMKNDYSWRIPLILQAAACLVVIVSVYWLPESPRFLMANGREDEAVAFLARFHGNGDPHSRLVVLEVEEMKETIRQDGIDKSDWDYRPLFTTHNGRWRMTQVIMISVFGQFSGNGLGYFNTVIFANIGVSNVGQQLGYNLLNSVLSAAGALTAVVGFVDRVPRRRVLVLGTLACAAALACNSGLSAALDHQQHSGDGVIKPSYARGALASYFFFNILFSFTYTPLQAVIPSEALETTTRAKGLALHNIIVNAVGFINQFCGPIALGNIGYKYIYIFVGWDCIEALLWYLFGVESLGRTLEQLEWVYNQPNPVKASQTVDKVVIQADGTVTEKVVANA